MQFLIIRCYSDIFIPYVHLIFAFIYQKWCVYVNSHTTWCEEELTWPQWNCRIYVAFFATCLHALCKKTRWRKLSPCVFTWYLFQIFQNISVNKNQLGLVVVTWCAFFLTSKLESFLCTKINEKFKKREMSTSFLHVWAITRLMFG